MRPRYSFSSKHTRRATDSRKMRKQKSKYPKLLKEIIDRSDIIVEILDARFPEKTRNKDIENSIQRQGKKLIYILNKSDLVQEINKSEIQDLNPKILISCIKRKGVHELRDLIKIEAKRIDKEIKRRDDKILVGIIGYPNTGKSSLINLLVGKKVAGTGSEAGFTKGIQKLKLTDEIQLLDSPGVIPESEYSSVKKQAIAKHTIVGGRSWSKVRDSEMVIDFIIKEFPNILENNYKIKAEGNSEILIEELGKKWNYFKKGGIVDEDKVSRRILKEWQLGNIRI